MKRLLEKLESKILTKLFTRWLDNEFDTELLELTRSMVYNREVLVKTMIDKANYKPIYGFQHHLKKDEI